MTESTTATILVTGATDGLGRRVALELAGRGATMLLHGRDRGRCEAALEEVRGRRAVSVRATTSPISPH
jgi:short-subunit dehydrogenase